MAITSINVTYFLKEYFQLMDQLDPKKDFERMCSDDVLFTFKRLLSKDKKLFEDLHNFLLIEIFNTWAYFKDEFNIGLMNFNIATKHV